MKCMVSIVMAALVWGAMAADGIAQQRKGQGQPRGKAVAVADADLEKEIGRTLAELNAERAAEKPDQAKITELTSTLRQLRARARTQAGATAGGNQAGACPFGGPGSGMGSAGGMGQGQGMGMGRGPGGGRGMGGGQGRGPGGGRK